MAEDRRGCYGDAGHGSQGRRLLLGAALLAGVGIGLFPDVRTAVERCVQFEDSITPDRENHEKYGRYFAIYRKIHDALAPVEKQIHETFVMGK